MSIDTSRYALRLAETEADRLGAERLRYRVFVEEMGAAASAAQHAARREWDAFDSYFDHLVLVDLAHAGDDPLDRVVGVYRLMTDAAARAGPGFYSGSEFDLGPILGSGRRSLELGRSCIAQAHRGGPALHLLWNGLARYVLDRGTEILFGVASFPGKDPEAVAEALSHLHHAYRAPEDLRVKVRGDHGLGFRLLPPEAVDPRRAMRAVPPLIQAYLRVGGFVGEGVFLDTPFNTIDVCVVMDTSRMTERYRQFYERGRAPGRAPDVLSGRAPDVLSGSADG